MTPNKKFCNPNHEFHSSFHLHLGLSFISYSGHKYIEPQRFLHDPHRPPSWSHVPPASDIPDFWTDIQISTNRVSAGNAGEAAWQNTIKEWAMRKSETSCTVHLHGYDLLPWDHCHLPACLQILSITSVAVWKKYWHHPFLGEMSRSEKQYRRWNQGQGFLVTWSRICFFSLLIYLRWFVASLLIYFSHLDMDKYLFGRLKTHRKLYLSRYH